MARQGQRRLDDSEPEESGSELEESDAKVEKSHLVVCPNMNIEAGDAAPYRAGAPAPYAQGGAAARAPGVETGDTRSR